MNRQDYLNELRTKLADMRLIIAQFDIQLRDYYQRRGAIRYAIIETFPHFQVQNRHNGPDIVVSGYRWADPVRSQRANLQAELDRLDEVFGPIKSERRNNAIEAEGLKRAIDHIVAWDEKHPQNDLFEVAK